MKAHVLAIFFVTALGACQTSTSTSTFAPEAGNSIPDQPRRININNIVENYHLWEKHSRNMKIKPVFAKFKGRDAVAIEARVMQTGVLQNDWDRFGSPGHAQRYQWCRAL